MRFHPAVLMLIVWLSALAALIVLPFELTYREIDPKGVLILLAFMLLFCAGSVLRSRHVRQQPVTSPQFLNTRRADRMLKWLSGLACACMGLEVVVGGGLDLGSAYVSRSMQAQAILYGNVSGSSIFFKIGFICYPASYVFLVRSLLLDVKPRWSLIIVFGVMPALLAGFAMGGRSPIFLTMAYGYLAYTSRSILFPHVKKMTVSRKVSKVHPAVKILSIVSGILVFNYFVNVFIVRAEIVGGAEYMLNVAALQWGVTFGGPVADAMILLLGIVTTYLIFVFSWYLVQGVIMSNSIFINYDGGALWGVYGVDLLTAVMRRIDPDWVANEFSYLLDLDTYGFFPSAFGSLYVDFLLGGMLVVFAWGWLASVVYRKIRIGRDPRWFIVSPFVVMGIIFSLINTPIGFSNGFVTHFWLLITYFLIRRTSTSY